VIKWDQEPNKVMKIPDIMEEWVLLMQVQEVFNNKTFKVEALNGKC
jgi:hypothetical protein